MILIAAVVLVASACSGASGVETAAPTSTGASSTSSTAGTLPPGTVPPGTVPGTAPDTLPPATEPPTIPPTAAPATTAAPVTAPRPTTRPPTTPTPTTPPPTAAPATVAPPPPLPPGANSVFVMGDSVLLGTTSTVPAALVGWNVTMDVGGSRRLTQALPILQARRGEIGRVLVIQLGNNYIPGEGGSFASQIDQAMQIVSGVERVVWITVAEVNGASRVAINNDIRAAAGRHPNIVVAEWAPIVAAHPDYAPGDALHLSAQGRVAMADLVAAAVGPAP